MIPSLSRRLVRWRAPLASLVLIAPCLLAPRIQAGDLSSHVYNAWLAQLIEQGRAPGLYVAPMFTNWLFDALLLNAWKLAGPAIAQRFAVSVSLLVFFWGAFALATCIARRPPWPLAPILAMLSYGWLFHSGFFNFYLSLGLCFWIMKLLWTLTWTRAMAALPIFFLAASAHILPLAPAIALLAYLHAARRVRPRRRPFLVLAALAALAAAAVLLSMLLHVRWSPNQWALISGADHLLAFGPKYFLLLFFTLVLWAGLLVRLFRTRSWLRAALDPRIHLPLLCAAAVVILPSDIQAPGVNHALYFVSERTSLWVAVFLTGLAASTPLRRDERWLPPILAAVFFTFLAYDWHALNRFEDQLHAAVSALPPNQRVVSAVSGESAAINPLVHMIDRACIGRCFSYANYEPSSAGFRVRARTGNPIVIDSYPDSFALQSGGYVVKTADLPLYGVFPGSGGTLHTRPLQAGERLQITAVACPPPFF